MFNFISKHVLQFSAPGTVRSTDADGRFPVLTAINSFFLLNRDSISRRSTAQGERHPGIFEND